MGTESFDIPSDDDSDDNVDVAAKKIFEEWYIVEDSRADESLVSAAETQAYQEGLLKALEILTTECSVEKRTDHADRNRCDDCGSELVEMLGGARCTRCE